MNAQSNAAADGVNSPVVSMQAMTNATYLSCGRNKGYRQRQCILVTNNEVSEEENRTLTEQGFQPGQDEWEQHGICRSVTWHGQSSPCWANVMTAHHCRATMASARLRIVLDQPSPAARPSRCVRGSCGARPLRPPASLLHNAALPSVPASRYAKASLGAGHRFAPFG